MTTPPSAPDLVARLHSLAGDYAESGGSNHPHRKLIDEAAAKIEQQHGALMSAWRITNEAQQTLHAEADLQAALCRIAAVMQDTELPVKDVIQQLTLTLSKGKKK